MSTLIEQYITNKHVSVGLAERLRSSAVEEQKVIEIYLSQLAPSANALRDLLQLTDEICRRDGIESKELLEKEELKSLLLQESASRKEKYRQIRELLEGKRYPEAKYLKQMLAEYQKKLVRQFNLKVRLPKDLEGDSITITITAKSQEELAEFAARMKAMSHDPTTAKIFSTLKGNY